MDIIEKLVSKNEEGKLISTSKSVAGIFGKRHDNALKLRGDFEMKKLPLGAVLQIYQQRIY